METLRCFQHCQRNINILCFNVPHYCPICGQDTDVTESRIPPYPLPTPFCVSSDVKTGIVIRPTLGDFIRNYTNKVDLHVGITDSTGCLYDFDEDGLHIGQVWPQCVAVHLPSNFSISQSHWTQCLKHFADRRIWHPDSYHEQVNNCFDFVFSFLESLNINHFVPELNSKSHFVAKVVIPSTSKAEQFVSLYRQVQAAGFVCQSLS